MWLCAGGSYIVSGKAATKVAKHIPLGNAMPIKRKNGIFVIPVRRGSQSEEQHQLCPVTDPSQPILEAPPGLAPPTARQEAKPTEQAQVAFAKSLPATPSEEDRERHNLTHVPFRTWCADCIAGQATEDKHKRRKDKPDDRTIATMGLDYCFLGRDNEKDQATTLILALKPANCVGASVVPEKGVCEPAVQCVLFYLEVWGVTAVTLKCDQEPGIIALCNEVRKRRDHSTMLEKAPKHDHKANGHIENTVRRVESLTRTYVAAIGRNLGEKVGAKSLILPWLVHHSAFVLTRFAIGADGRTPWQRVRGKSFESELCESGRRSS